MYVPDNWWPPTIGSNPYDVLPTANSSLDASNTTSTTPYDGLFHWTSHTGDTLWFSGWKPYTESAYIGACIGLVFMALAFRALEALKIYYLVCVTEALTKISITRLPVDQWQKQQQLVKNDEQDVPAQTAAPAEPRNIEDDDDGTTYRSVASSAAALPIEPRRKSYTLHMSSAAATADSDSESLRRPEAIDKCMQQRQRERKEEEHGELYATRAFPGTPGLSWKSSVMYSLLETLQVFIGILLVLAIVTGNVAYLLSIVAGIFGGSLIFCRFKALKIIAASEVGAPITGVTSAKSSHILKSLYISKETLKL